jgi:hypothetical protein
VTFARVCAVAALLLGCTSPPAALAPLPAEDPIFLDDFTALRTAFGAREDFHRRCEQDRPMQALFERFGAEQWQGVLEVSLPWLEQCPVDIDARVASAIACQKLGRAQEADLHKRWYNGLVDSVLASGDGKTAQTAFVVISVGEEYALLRAMGLESRGQMLVEGGIDALTVEGESGTEVIYFNPASHWVRMDRMRGDGE